MRTPWQILEDATTLAVVGASRDPEKPSHSVPRQLQRHGWRVIPVNPYADEIWGERCYRSLADIGEPIDLVIVFRPSAQALAVVRDALAVGTKAIWLQTGIVSSEGRRLAEAAGVDYVEDRCTAVERALGRLTKLPA